VYKWSVMFPVSSLLEVEVEANTEEEALEKGVIALENLDTEEAQRQLLKNAQPGETWAVKQEQGRG